MKPRKRILLVLLLIGGLATIPSSAVAHAPVAHSQETDHPEASQDAEGADQAVDHGQDASEHGEESVEEEVLDPVHHNSDAYYIDFAPIGTLELPRIFIVRDAGGALGLDIYASTTSALASGKYAAHMAEGEHGSALDAKIQASEGEVVLDLSITKHLIFAWIGALLVIIIFVRLARMYARGPGRETAPKGIFQNMMEAMVMFVRDDIARPILGPKSDKYLPYLLTAFFFILTCNLLGLIPYGATATSNIMVTAVLATFTFVLTQLGGTKDYWLHIFWAPDTPVFVRFILMPVEILGLFTKPFALAVRLFANMTAGHLVILSLIGLIFAFTNLFGSAVGYGVAPISVAFALFINLLEILVACIQAYVFTMLSALFIGMAVEEHHHAEHDHDDGRNDSDRDAVDVAVA